MSKPCPFSLPPGVSYDGPWPGMKPAIHQFTDRAETKSTFGVYLKDFNEAGVRGEDAGDIRRGGGGVMSGHCDSVDALICACPECLEELVRRREKLRGQRAKAEADLRANAADEYAARNHRAMMERRLSGEIAEIDHQLRRIATVLEGAPTL